MRKLADISSFERLQDQAHRDMGLVSDMSVFNVLESGDAVALLDNGEILTNVVRKMQKDAKEYLSYVYGDKIDPYGEFIDVALYRALQTNKRAWNLLTEYNNNITTAMSEKFPVEERINMKGDRIVEVCRECADDLWDAMKDQIPQSLTKLLLKMVKDVYKDQPEAIQNATYGVQNMNLLRFKNNVLKRITPLGIKYNKGGFGVFSSVPLAGWNHVDRI